MYRYGEANDKVLLFSCSTRLLDILEKFLARRGYVFCRLDGSTPGRWGGTSRIQL
jgi:SNF2 family DNA or RNA helicase